MYIACWNCGGEVWLETQKVCRHCDSPIHRCADCVNFESAGPTCAVLHIDLNPVESEHPTRLALSMTCVSWEMTQAAMARKPLAKPNVPAQATPPAPTPASAAAAPAAARPATPAPAPAAPAVGLTDEFITIRREPPLKRPKHPLIIAHRGESSGAPENTLSAFGTAVASGAHGVEFDIHLSSDGVPVAIHDATVDRCSNGTGAVAEMTLEQLKALDAGSWFAGPYEGERIPTLDQTLEALPSPTVLIIHLRAHENNSDRCERAVAETIEKHQARKRSVITHHTRHGLQRLREIDANLRVCWIPYGVEPLMEYVDDALYMGCRMIQPRAAEIDEALVAYAHNKDMWVTAFWADEADEMKRLIALGVDGIITNYPRRLREVMTGKS